jgi:membrane-associated phospholipid phosphatase
MDSWISFTHFGGSTVMLSAAVVITAWLIAGRAWRMAFWWCGLLGVGLLLVLATKIAFVGWGVGIRSIDFTGISGHSMRATAVMPVLLYLILQKRPRLVCVAGVLLGLMFGVLIGISRLILNAHSMSEAVAGCILGGMISLGFILISRNSPKPVLNRWFIALSLMIVLGAGYAESVPTQRLIRDVALYLAGHERPYIRATWKMAPALPSTPVDENSSKQFMSF